MNQTKNSKLTGISKVLRKNMTKEEKHLWYDFLKQLPQTVHRQKVIGPYIVDFYCHSAKLVIETDGSQHFYDEEQVYDHQRTEYLEQKGLHVLRISNRQINEEFKSVCEHIDMIVKNSLSPR